MSALAMTALAAAAMGHGDAGHGAMGHAATAGVRMGFAQFTPARVDVVAGDAVRWRNDSVRTHTVDAVDGSFASGPIPSTGEYERRFDTPGVVPYVCTRHPSMDGEVGVFTVLLEPPQGAGRPGTPRILEGRSSLPPGTEVPMQADDGTGLAPAGTAVVDADHGLRLRVAPRTSTTYRAVADGAGPPVTAQVADRRVALRSVTRGKRRLVVDAGVTPAAHGTPAVLQLRIPERFGWWPVARATVDRRSRVRLRVPLRRRLAARVVLTLPDGATVVATSRTLHAEARARSRPTPRHP